MTLPLPLGRKIKAGVCPYPDATLSQDIVFGADLDIAYSHFLSLIREHRRSGLQW